MSTIGEQQLSPRKREILDHAERIAADRLKWIERSGAYYRGDRSYMRFLVPAGARVLDLGCGVGDLLAWLQPSFGLGVDLSPQMVAEARKAHPGLQFLQGDIEDPEFVATIEGPFDFIVLSDTIGSLDDIETTLNLLHRLCTPDTRIVIAYYSHLWEPVLTVASKLGQKMPQPPVNFVSSTDFQNILDLASFEPIRRDTRQLLPVNIPVISRIINRYIAPLPGIRAFGLRTYIVARSRLAGEERQLSTTILIPCRNERGNIENAIKRMPRFGGHQEIVYVEGNSSDGTLEECFRVRDAYKDVWDIKVLKQPGKGKGDAVRAGFAAAGCDIVMILDADLTMPPEALPKFFGAVQSGKGEFINGTRLVYPMEREAMRPLNLLANRFFARIFSYLINQRFTDTLCGTKVLKRKHYLQIAANRAYFGDFDPFGDFDLLLGASKQNLRIIEVPIHYGARNYGETQISRFRDGFMLLRMVVFAFKKLKAV